MDAPAEELKKITVTFRAKDAEGSFRGAAFLRALLDARDPSPSDVKCVAIDRTDTSIELVLRFEPGTES